MRLPALLLLLTPFLQASPLPTFTPGKDFNEQIRWTTLDYGVRVYTNAPEKLDPQKPTDVILFATPNGNTIEQTLGGSAPTTAPIDWHYDIQHILAQTRRLREIEPDRNIVLAVIDNPQKSWPTFRKDHPDIAQRAPKIAAEALRDIPGSPVRLTVAGHSGGGSFIFAMIEQPGPIPDQIDRIAFLDANYNYADAAHGDKLLTWLRDKTHRLIVIAYDDREITLDGKKVLSPTGGTYRASHRMIDRFSKDFTVTESKVPPFDAFSALDGRVRFFIHPNPENKILHTRLVGEMNGLLEAMTVGTEFETKWGTFGGPRAYDTFVRPIPTTQPTTKAAGGLAIMRSLVSLPAADRENILRDRLTHGGMPAFMSHFKTIHLAAKLSDGQTHSIDLEVSPDYVCIGSDTDFVRTPLTPKAAIPIAAALGCTLPTRKLVDEIDRHAEIKLEPTPMTTNRESVDTFIQHNQLIETQRAGHPLGGLITGIKKDVVLTNRLHEKPNRVAIYGWRQLDGKPIQPLTTVHVDWYVDYSHGIRLVRQAVTIDGKPSTLVATLKDPLLCELISDEGPIDVTSMYAEH